MSFIVRARAPLRVEFCGGGTDVAPWSVERGSALFNAALAKYATVSVYERERKDGDVGVIIEAIDLDVHDHRLVSTKPVEAADAERFLLDRRGGQKPGTLEVDHVVRNEAALSAVKACMNLVGLTESDGFYLHSVSDSPPGTGLGSSSASIVAMLKALWDFRVLRDGREDSPFSPLVSELTDKGIAHAEQLALAKLAWEVERRLLGQPGGWQDHVASVLGGFNYVRSEPGHEWPFDTPHAALVEHWWPGVDVVGELEACSVLAYVGRRAKTGYIEGLQAGMKADSLRKCMDEAEALHQEVRRGDLSAFGLRVGDAWLAKVRTAPMTVPDRVLSLYKSAGAFGAIGGCLVGAGGGGFLFLYCEPQLKHRVMGFLERERVPVWPFTFTPSGAESWVVK